MSPQDQGQYLLAAGSDMLTQLTLPGSRKLVNGKAVFMCVCLNNHSGTKLDHTHSHVYLGITLDRSLTYRNHCLKTRAKLSSRNNLLRNWRACPHTMRTTATVLCLSVAAYCCPVWARSTHRKLVDTTLNETCRLITGCIRPTATPDLYVLSSIAPPEIRRSIHSQNERTKQLTDQRHSLHHHQPVKSRLHSCNSFVSTSQPLLCKPAEAHVAIWQEQWEATEDV